LKWIIASRNRDKLQEIKKLFSSLEIQFLSLLDFPNFEEIKEEGYVFAENAVIKAKKVFEALRYPTIADDSGLVVDALYGMPGVFSSRFAGEEATYRDNRKKLLNMLEGLPFHKRRAKFVCVVAFVNVKGEVFIEEGEVEGFITEYERGEGGFGYDPIFLYPPLGRTFSEIPLEIKNRISHRGIAFRKILERIRRNS